MEAISNVVNSIETGRSLVLAVESDMAVNFTLKGSKLHTLEYSTGESLCPEIDVFNKEVQLLVSKSEILLSAVDIHDRQSLYYFDNELKCFVPVMPDSDEYSGSYKVYDISVDDETLSHNFRTLH